MNEADIRTVLQEELGNIAPEMDLQALDPSVDLREALDIDSMDFLNFVIAVHHRLGVDIPSGLHGDTGEVLGFACRCDVTVTFEAPKHGLLVAAAQPYVGRLEVVPLGLPGA